MKILLIFVLAVNVALILKFKDKSKESRRYWAEVQSMKFRNDMYQATSAELPEVVYDKDGKEYHKVYSPFGDATYLSEDEIKFVGNICCNDGSEIVI